MNMLARTLLLGLCIPALANASNIIRVAAPVQKSAATSESGTETPVASATLTLADAMLPVSRAGDDYLFDFSPLANWIDVQGNFIAEPLTWSVSSGMPSGLSMSSAGLLSGFPMAAGTHSLQVKAASGSYSASHTYSLTVDPAVSVSLNTASLPAATSGAPYSYDFTQHLAWQGLRAGESQPSMTWSSSGSLPAGLSLSSSGVLSGSPVQAGTSTVDVTATGSGYTASNSYSLTVQQPVDAISARYFRINITANNGDAYTAVQEIEMHSVAGGSDITTPSTVATNSSNYQNNTASKTVDNDFTSYSTNTWVSLGGAPYPHILTYDLGSVKNVKEITVWPQAYVYGPNRSMKNFSIEYSNDGTNWTVAKSFSNVTGWSNGASKTFQLK